MARLDVYRRSDRDTLVLDCQGDMLAELPTRFVIPLLKPDGLPRRFERLHPIVSIAGERRLVATHLATSIPVRDLGSRIGSLAHEHFRIMDALDTLFSDY